MAKLTELRGALKSGKAEISMGSKRKHLCRTVTFDVPEAVNLV